MKIFTGTVTSKKMNNTATVTVERVVQHPLYGKRLKRTRTYHVHDEMNANVGDVVRFVATKPISKTKRWKLTEIINGPVAGEKAKKSKKPTAKAAKKSK